MKKKTFSTIFVLLFIVFILIQPNLSGYYALSGLNLWFTKMIPTLFPFMILSSVLIHMNATQYITKFTAPIIGKLFGLSPNGSYALIVGFLCGFPMGAKTVGDLYGKNMISYEEAKYLLAFCNNIGPIYFFGYLLPTINKKPKMIYIMGMYLLPLLYGAFLKSIGAKNAVEKTAVKLSTVPKEVSFMQALDYSISQSMESILQLGGYMIIFNLLNLIPHVITGKPSLLLAPFIEISGGLQLLKNHFPIYSLTLVSFGGLSCIAQTYSCLEKSGLSKLLPYYIFHKSILSLITFLYYLCFFRFFAL